MGPMICGFMSFLVRKTNIIKKNPSVTGVIPKNPPNIPAGIVNDAFCAFIGYSFANFFAILWNYQAREYVRERLRHEKQIQFDRHRFMKQREGDLLEDYETVYRYNDSNSTSKVGASMMTLYSRSIFCDNYIRELRRLSTDDPEKLETLKSIHKDFAAGIKPKLKSNDQTKSMEIKDGAPVDPVSGKPKT